MRTRQHRGWLWLAADLAWPRAAIADPTTLGFTRAGLDALDARLKQSVAHGDTAGMTDKPMAPRRPRPASSTSHGRR